MAKKTSVGAFINVFNAILWGAIIVCFSDQIVMRYAGFVLATLLLLYIQSAEDKKKRGVL